MPHTISVASTEYVRVPISGTVDGAAVDITADTVQMAFVATGAALAAGDWETADWETDTVDAVDTYYARRLVTAGDLGAGTYRVYVKVVDNPETPVLEATDTLVVT